MGRPDPEITELSETLKSNEPAATASFTTAIVSQSDTNQEEQSSSSSWLADELIVGHRWTTGLFDFRENQRNAIVTALLPCVTFGQIAEVLDEGHSTSTCRGSCYFFLILASYSQWVFSTEYRTKLRKKYNLEEGPYTDVIAHILCPCCSLCQEYRELQNRGLDPALGWKGIVAQQQGKRMSDDEQSNIPPSNQVMSK